LSIKRGVIIKIIREEAKKYGLSPLFKSSKSAPAAFFEIPDTVVVDLKQVEQELEYARVMNIDLVEYLRQIVEHEAYHKEFHKELEYPSKEEANVFWEILKESVGDPMDDLPSIDFQQKLDSIQSKFEDKLIIDNMDKKYGERNYQKIFLREQIKKSPKPPEYYLRYHIDSPIELLDDIQAIILTLTDDEIKAYCSVFTGRLLLIKKLMNEVESLRDITMDRVFALIYMICNFEELEVTASL